MEAVESPKRRGRASAPGDGNGPDGIDPTGEAINFAENQTSSGLGVIPWSKFQELLLHEELHHRTPISIVFFDNTAAPELFEGNLGSAPVRFGVPSYVKTTGEVVDLSDKVTELM